MISDNHLTQEEKEALWVADDVKEALATYSVINRIKNNDPIAIGINESTQKLAKLATKCIRIKDGSSMQVAHNLCKMYRELRAISIDLATILQKYGLLYVDEEGNNNE